ncbi:MAG: hypothetical protein KDD38_06425, partial [Bdellovibrionales bacterium]|nr:hypothetical protein [Bdellovibrionales bacterium]
MYISKVTKLIAILSLLSAGCTKPNEVTQNHQLSFEIKNVDREIPLEEIKKIKINNLYSTIGTAELFNYLEESDSLNKPTRPNTTIEAKEIYAEFYKTPQVTSHVEFENSPYADFIISKSKNDFLSATENLDDFFKTQQELVLAAIASTTSRFDFPKSDITLPEALQKIAGFISAVEIEVLKSSADTAVKESVVQSLYQKFWLKLPTATASAIKIEATENFASSVQTIQSLIKELDIELTQDQTSELHSAAELGEMLNADLDPQKAFNILIQTWEIMSPDERRNVFGEISPELNFFLSTQKEKNRDCLKNKECKNFVLNFSKNVVILPKIKKYGIENLRQKVETSALERIKSQTSSIATALVTDIPRILEEEVIKGFADEKSRFLGYRSDYDRYVREELKSWYKKTYASKELPALETTNVNIIVNPDEIHIMPERLSENYMITSADAIGAALSSTNRLLRRDSQSQLLGLTRINQLLAHGGFSLYSGKPFPSLMRELFGSGESRTQNIENFFAWPSLFAMPTPATVKSGFQLAEGSVPEDFIILSQSRLLKGFSRMMLAFRDWEPSLLGDMMSTIKVKDFLVHLPASEVNISAFPKEAFLAISLGNAAAILSNLKANGTPLFIMCQDHSVIWADKSTECAQATALAGVVDIIKNKRQHKVDTISHAEFLESLIEFLQAAEATKKTKSEYLIKKA